MNHQSRKKGGIAMMNGGFANVVEHVKSLSFDEKEELYFLLEHYLSEERREEIYRNYKRSLKEQRENKLRFSSEIDQLRNMLA
jgi:hypothetical protein